MWHVKIILTKKGNTTLLQQFHKESHLNTKEKDWQKCGKKIKRVHKNRRKTENRKKRGEKISRKSERLEKMRKNKEVKWGEDERRNSERQQKESEVKN